MVDVEDLLEMRNNPALAGWRQVAPAREIMADRDVNAAVASWATRVNSKDLPAQPVPGRKFKVPTITVGPIPLVCVVAHASIIKLKSPMIKVEVEVGPARIDKLVRH